MCTIGPRVVTDICHSRGWCIQLDGEEVRSPLCRAIAILDVCEGPCATHFRSNLRRIIIGDLITNLSLPARPEELCRFNQLLMFHETKGRFLFRGEQVSLLYSWPAELSYRFRFRDSSSLFHILCTIICFNIL